MNFKLPAFITCSSLLLLGCGGNDSRLSLVKNGAFDFCPQATVKEMVDSYIANPSWEAFVATDGNDYVNVEGQIYYYEALVDMLLQFRVNDDMDRFEVNAFEIEGESQYEFMTNALLENMCDEAS